MPNSAQLLRSVWIWVRLTSSLIELDADQRQRVVGRGVVVLGREGEVGAVDRSAGQAQPVERLRARHLVDEVHVDVEQIRLAGGGVHDVAVPELLG